MTGVAINPVEYVRDGANDGGSQWLMGITSVPEQKGVELDGRGLDLLSYNQQYTFKKPNWVIIRPFGLNLRVT